MNRVPVKQGASGSMDRCVRSGRNFGAMQERRMQAADMFEQGVIPAEVARQVGVSHQIVSDWRAAWRRSGRVTEHPKAATGEHVKSGHLRGRSRWEVTPPEVELRWHGVECGAAL